jgi:hypothetical protein
MVHSFICLDLGGGIVDDQQLDGTFDRRAFVKKMAVVGAFVVPAVVSFKLDSLAQAGIGHGYPNQTYPNQTYPNQTYPNQGWQSGGFRWAPPPIHP